MSYDLKRLALYDKGRWFQFPIGFLHFMPDREAILLASLINIVCMKDPEECEDGWFKVSQKRISNSLMQTFTEEKIKRALKGLKAKNIVLTKVTPNEKVAGGREQWIYISYDVLDILDQGGGVKNDPTVGGNQGGGVKYHPTVGSNITLPNTGQSNGSRDPGSLRTSIKNSKHVLIKKKVDVTSNEWCNQAATTFASDINKTRKVNKNSNLGTWAKHFKLLHTQDGYDIDHIQKVLKWYGGEWARGDLNIRATNPRFHPTAICGKDFREKFTKIEMAMDRTLAEQGKTQPSSVVKCAVVNSGEMTEKEQAEFRNNW